MKLDTLVKISIALAITASITMNVHFQTVNNNYYHEQETKINQTKYQNRETKIRDRKS